MAHFSADAALIAAFTSGDDVFKAVASKWLGKPAGEVSPASRYQRDGMQVERAGSHHLFGSVLREDCGRNQRDDMQIERAGSHHLFGCAGVGGGAPAGEGPVLRHPLRRRPGLPRRAGEPSLWRIPNAAVS